MNDFLECFLNISLRVENRPDDPIIITAAMIMDEVARYMLDLAASLAEGLMAILVKLPGSRKIPVRRGARFRTSIWTQRRPRNRS